MAPIEDERPAAEEPRLLVCRFNRLFAVFIILASLVFVLIPGDALLFHVLIKAKGLGLSAFLVVLMLIALFGVYVGIRQFMDPTVLLEVTARGLFHRYYDSDRNKRVFFVPWDRIRGFRFMKTTASSGNRTVLVRAVAVDLSVDDEWKVPDGASHLQLKEDNGSTLYIDAVNPVPGGQQLLEALKSLGEQHGVAS